MYYISLSLFLTQPHIHHHLRALPIATTAIQTIPTPHERTPCPQNNSFPTNTNYTPITPTFFETSNTSYPSFAPSLNLFPIALTHFVATSSPQNSANRPFKPNRSSLDKHRSFMLSFSMNNTTRSVSFNSSCTSAPSSYTQCTARISGDGSDGTIFIAISAGSAISIVDAADDATAFSRMLTQYCTSLLCKHVYHSHSAQSPTNDSIRFTKPRRRSDCWSRRAACSPATGASDSEVIRCFAWNANAILL